MVMKNCKVLVTAPSNSATDNLVERLLETEVFDSEKQLYRYFAGGCKYWTVKKRVLVSSQLLFN